MSSNKLSKRERAINELIATETTYVKQLGDLIKYYMKPLENNTKIIPQKEFKIIFPGSLITIYNLNSSLLTELLKRKQKAGNADLIISDILINFIPFFKMYQSYLNKSTFQLKTIGKLLQNNKLFKEFQQKNRQKFNNLSLSDLIILPIQRIPRYKLLTGEILERSDKTHSDFHGLQKAFDLISHVNIENNNKLKELEQRIKVFNICKKIENVPNLSSPSRRFIYSNKLSMIKKSGKIKKRMFYLFNDCLLYCSKSNNVKTTTNKILSPKLGQYHFKMLLAIDCSFSIQKIKQSTKHKKYTTNSFIIYSSFESFIVTTGNNHILYNEWLNVLKECIDTAQSKHYFNRGGRASKEIITAMLQIPNELEVELKESINKNINPLKSKSIEIYKDGFSLNIGDIAISNAQRQSLLRSRSKEITNLLINGDDNNDINDDDDDDDKKEETKEKEFQFIKFIKKIKNNNKKRNKTYGVLQYKQNNKNNVRSAAPKPMLLKNHNYMSTRPPIPTSKPPTPAAKSPISRPQKKVKKKKHRKVHSLFNALSFSSKNLYENS